MTTGASAPFGVADAVDRLRAPDAPERFSPVAEESLLAVDLAQEGRALHPPELAEAADALRRIPAPSIALRGGPLGPGAKHLLEHFDAVVDTATELAVLRERIAANPRAASVLVQLLRDGETRDVEAGLVAESLAYSTLQAGPEFATWLAGHERRPAKTHSEPAVRFWRELDRLHVALNRPEKHNAFSAAMRDDLCEALSLAVTDESIEEIVLSGAGASFCSGGDLDEFGTLPDPATAHAIRTTRSAARLLERCANRVHATVHGACVGAGIELPAFAARVTARADAFVVLPELTLGLVPGAGGTVSLPRRIGRQRTARLALSAERLDAETARDWGLFDALQPA
ncbi:MAG: enoyl-CoA hydratase/isomerase family protein [Myxococcota bacterium]|nr:enoyl-CoA hydratase/isomerase family protein [Myxococcota bacterium]